MSRSPEKRSAFLVGTGVVGKAFVALADRSGSGVDLAFVANRRGIGRSGAELDALLALPPREPPRAIDDATLDELAAKEKPVLVDATAWEGAGALYRRALQRGIAVVSANKKPFAGPLEEWNALADETRAPLLYSATVGAGLPIVSTLQGLVSTGDKVTRIDCVLSGTLGFLVNAIDQGVPFSSALATAKERGFTEPDPRDDLGGADVARKLVILARTLGAEIDLADVDLTPLVDPDTALDAALDRDFEARARSAAKRGEKLVYLACIERAADGRVTASAGPTLVPRTHPAATLAPSAALAAFTTVRHERTPLVVSGSGAGGEITAAGLLADILKT
ncbi:MAG TPA: hypothetical protein VF407_06530 [Polyangiaceae bacterium]